jgi:hypothetical protein
LAVPGPGGWSLGGSGFRTGGKEPSRESTAREGQPTGGGKQVEGGGEERLYGGPDRADEVGELGLEATQEVRQKGRRIRHLTPRNPPALALDGLDGIR